MDILTVIYLIFIVAPVGTLTHETGHVLGAKSAGADKITLSIGGGKVIHRTKWKELAITVHVLFFLGGIAYSERKVPFKAGEMIRISASGPLISALTACMCYAFYVNFPNDYMLLLLLFNIWLAVINSVPFRIKGKQSDGYTIYKIIIQRFTTS